MTYRTRGPMIGRGAKLVLFALASLVALEVLFFTYILSMQYARSDEGRTYMNPALRDWLTRE